MPPSLAHHFATEAYNNAWSNHRLLAACEQLTQEEFAAPRTSFFPSIRATLNHTLTVDWYCLEMLERSLAGEAPHESPHRFFDPAEPFDSCAPLASAQRACDRRLTAFCESLCDARLDDVVLVPRSSGVQRDRVSRILAHLFVHQLHHRGQVHAMLAGTRVAPPQLDEFFCIGDADRRAGDFAGMGITETQVWGERAFAP